jgi:hypothetical protein
VQVIRRVDPTSEGVEMSRTQTISLDVGAQDVVVHFGGIEEVRVTCAGRLSASRHDA